MYYVSIYDHMQNSARFNCKKTQFYWIF